jgi:dUTP pyrophosphatase
MTTFSDRFPLYMRLKIYVNGSDSCGTDDPIDVIKQMYVSAVNSHNNNVLTNPFPDAGFDLFSPNNHVVLPFSTHKINFGLKCSATMIHSFIQDEDDINSYNTGFYVYPRSSLGSKTPLRLANSVGIIDSGYRGNLMGVFDNNRSDEYAVSQFDKLVQICAPGLVPILVQVVDNESELGDLTTRGEGGFGSTGMGLGSGLVV